jgi:hypothetical protein
MAPNVLEAGAGPRAVLTSGAPPSSSSLRNELERFAGAGFYGLAGIALDFGWDVGLLNDGETPLIASDQFAEEAYTKPEAVAGGGIQL